MTAKPLTLDVYRAEDMVATDGVALGEPVSFADELVMDDVYQLAATGALVPLALAAGQTGDPLHRADQPDHIVHLDCCLTLMAPDGSTHEALVLVEVTADEVAAIYLLPLTPLRAGVDYRLVGVERHTATRRFAEAANGSFARGTRITMGNGQMRPIEDLTPGDLVLTRDAGKQPIRWIGQVTHRATGAFAPVVIRKGALHNDNDLLLRPEHRLFVYQREDRLGAGRAEVMIKARQLINGDTVVQREGGFVEYFQLLFDDHYIIFAEGISAESQLVDPHTRLALPDDTPGPDHDHRPHLDYEVQDHLIAPARAANLLRNASAR